MESGRVETFVCNMSSILQLLRALIEFIKIDISFYDKTNVFSIIRAPIDSRSFVWVTNLRPTTL